MRVLARRSLIKDANFCKEDIPKTKKIDFEPIDECLERRRNEIQLTDKISEVATTITGYVAGKLFETKKMQMW